eukprot:gnl/MRDRNA2_/MRDRNA2_120794_c0_seq1.p1 gnl/MRDRNA2_/MRDRNA2_120794_c0~~gnl/MRDRNA2_/MRDRNA2_120794_c0_seq1.p1  ORF type:complete len:314 (-),score=66.45 gnl/MRDRNA2_/MRDRNA2_120794_c0_seq1:60-1001(-)
MAAVAQFTSVDNYKVKDVDGWSKGEVREFLADILPNHPCINLFQYTSGHVLATLQKEDIRRQAKDEEAANVIWAELSKFQKGTKARGLTTAGVPADGAYTIFVRTPAEVAMEFEVSPSDTVSILKTRLSDLEGTPMENQRLVWNGINMADDRTLASYNIQNGACVLLVPHLSASQRFVPPPAPRGMLMVPGNKSWQPSHAARPYMPVVASDTYRPFPMSLEFESVPDYKSFMSSAQKTGMDQTAAPGAPVLEIQGAATGQKPVQTKVVVDPDTEMLKLDTVGDAVAPNTQYSATMSFGSEKKKVTLTTGNRVG